jgi:hypothetical protein
LSSKGRLLAKGGSIPWCRSRNPPAPGAETQGQGNPYLSAIDDILRHPDDKPSIGIVLCKAKNEIVAE